MIESFTPPPLDVPIAHRVFTRDGDIRGKAALYFWGGIGLLVLAALGFFIALTTDVGPLALQAMANLPMLFAIGCFSAWFMIRRTPSEVLLSGDRVEVRRGTSSQSWALADLSMATVSTTSFIPRRRLKLFDRTGRGVAVIPDAIQPFDDLVTLIQAAIAQHEDDTTSAIRLKKSRRQGVLLVFLSILFGSLLTLLVYMDRTDAQNERLLRTRGEPTEAAILRRFTAPDGRTRRLEFRVTDVSGKTGDHNVEVLPAVWSGLQDVKTVPVVAVPGRPDVASLRIGQKKDGMNLSFGEKILIYLVGGAMCLFFLVGGLLNLYGIDIDLDSKTGKLSIKRFGTGR